MIERLVERLKKIRNDKVALLAQGTCTEFDQYKAMCAEIKTIDDVIGLIGDYVEEEDSLE